MKDEIILDKNNNNNIMEENGPKKDFGSALACEEYKYNFDENYEKNYEKVENFKEPVILKIKDNQIKKEDLKNKIEIKFKEKENELKLDLSNIDGLIFENYTVVNLKKIAKEFKIPKYYKLKKAELIKAILNKVDDLIKKNKEKLKQNIKEEIKEIKAFENKKESINKEVKEPEVKKEQKEEKEEKVKKAKKLKEKKEIKKEEPKTIKEMLKDPFEKTLIISEIEDKITFPYTYEEVEKEFKEGLDKYSSPQNIVEKFYTRDLKNYKNNAINRFKEGYKLIRERENGSIKWALSIGYECMVNKLIHPGIIGACKNSEELETYISCIEYDELEEFKVFDIVYKVRPVVKNDIFKFLDFKGF